MPLGMALTLYIYHGIMVAMAEISSFHCGREADQEGATTREFSEGAITVDVRILCVFYLLHC